VSQRAKIFLIIVAVVLVGLLVYIFLPTRKHNNSLIKIGALFDLTGAGADFGQDEAEATKMAIEEVNSAGGINGEKIQLILEAGPADDVNTSVTAFQKLVGVEKVPVVLGPTWDDVAAALAPLADRSKTVLLSSDASSGVVRSKQYNYFFSVFSPERSEMQRLVQFLKDRKVNKVATVYNLDPFSTQWQSDFVQVAKEQGLNVIGDFPVSDPEAKDFRTQITRLKELKPDAIYIEFASQDTKGPFLRQAKELNLTSLFVSSSTSDTESLLSNYGQYLHGLYIASPKKTDAAQAFIDKFKAYSGHPPKSPAAPYAYDAAKMLIDVLSRGARTGDEIRAALSQIKGFNGVTAQGISFDNRGRVVWPVEVYEMEVAEGGKFVQASR
jgi:branched-chain amino acid transport system substrate-binding protein